jgi:hypothetical protein
MDSIPTTSTKKRSRSIFHELLMGFGIILKTKYFYIALIILALGIQLNFASQTYLHNYIMEGKTLPMLSDLILDNIPFINVSFLYDFFAMTALVIMMIYVVHKNEYNRIPFFLLLFGIFYVVRGVFIVMTPFGNPPLFEGSNSPFKGFSKYDLGVYPSGHMGNVVLMVLLTKNKIYKLLLFICLCLIVISLFLAHGHYSIDIFSGLFFGYAIKSFGEKYFTMFEIKPGSDP